MLDGHLDGTEFPYVHLGSGVRLSTHDRFLTFYLHTGRSCCSSRGEQQASSFSDSSAGGLRGHEGLLVRPRAPSGFSNYSRIRKLLVGAVGIEPTTFGLKVR